MESSSVRDVKKNFPSSEAAALTTSRPKSIFRNERPAKKLLLRDANLKDDLTAYFTANPSEHGASVRPEVHVERYTITRGWAAAGVPLQTLDTLRPVLERQGASLTDSSHMRQDDGTLIRALERDSHLYISAARASLLTTAMWTFSRRPYWPGGKIMDHLPGHGVMLPKLCSRLRRTPRLPSVLSLFSSACSATIKIAASQPRSGLHHAPLQ